MENILFLPKKILNAELSLMIIEELFLLEISSLQDQALIVYPLSLDIMKVQEPVLLVCMRKSEGKLYRFSLSLFFFF
jgi:uncharacterized Tic20 family protein